MLFKQVQLFSLNKPLHGAISSLLPKMEPFLFKSCPPSFSSSYGFIAPTKESGAPLIYSVDHYLLFNIQFEDKVLPSGVIRKELDNKILDVQSKEDRKVYSKEKKALRDEITMTLLPRAFTQLSQVYACIDTKNQWLILNTLQADRSKAITSALKKCFDLDAAPLKLKKIPYILTQWIKNNHWPDHIDVLDHCFLQDPNQTKRSIRSQSQDIFSAPMQTFIDSGLEIKQVLLCWQNALRFTLTEQMHLKNARYEDQLAEDIDEAATESSLDRFNTDFILLMRTLEPLLLTLTQEFVDKSS